MKRGLTWLLSAGLAGLGGCSPGSPPAQPTANAADPNAGERIYRGSCIPCHQESGAGLPGVYPSLVGSPVVLGDPGVLARWVMKGQRPAEWPANRYATTMPRFGWLTPGDGAALLSFLRSHFGNQAAPVSAAAVSQALGG